MEPAAQTKFKRKRKVIITVWDGVTETSLFRQMDSGKAPAIKAIFNHGIFRSGHVAAKGNYGPDSYASVSGVGWRTIFGFTVNHGVFDHTIVGSREDVPDLLTLAKRQDPDFSGMASVTWKQVVEKMFMPFDTNRDFILESFSKYDVVLGDFLGDIAANQSLIDHLDRNKFLPDISIIGFNETDDLGHDAGFSPHNQAYLDGISFYSELGGVIVKKTQMEYAEHDILYIFTTDHGGRLRDRAHQNPSTEYTRRVWTIAHSPNYTIKNIGKVINAEDISALAFQFLGYHFPKYYEGKMGEVIFKAKRGPRFCKGLLSELAK